MKPTKQDFLLAVRKATFTLDPDAITLFGMLGEERFHHLKDASLTKKRVDSSLLLTEIEGTLSGPLGARAEVKEFIDFPVVKLALTLVNSGEEALTLPHLGLLHHEFCGDDPMLLDADGNRLDLPVPPPRPPKPKEGEKRPEMPHLPMFEGERYYLQFEDCTVLVLSSLPKRFHTEPAGASVGFGVRDTVLPASGEVSFPEITLLVCEGDRERAKAMLEAFEAIHG